MILLIIGYLGIVALWGTSIVQADSIPAEIQVYGRIGQEISDLQEKNKCDEKKTIGVDTSQIRKGRLPQAGSSDQHFLMLLGYVIIVLFLSIFIREMMSVKRSNS